MDETKFVCVPVEPTPEMIRAATYEPVHFNTTDDVAIVLRAAIAAAPQSHVAVERRYLEIVVKLAAGRRGAFMGHEASAIAHCRSLLAKE